MCQKLHFKFRFLIAQGAMERAMPEVYLRGRIRDEDNR